MVKCGALDFVLVDVGLLAVLLCGRGWGYARGCLVVTRAEGASFSVINFEQHVLLQYRAGSIYAIVTMAVYDMYFYYYETSWLG